MKSRFITHKGVRIFYGDYSNFGADTAALQRELDEVVKALTREPAGSVLSLSDVRGTMGSPGNLSAMKATVSQTNTHVRKRAIVGMDGVRKALLDIANMVARNNPLVPFGDLETAKEWLIK